MFSTDIDRVACETYRTNLGDHVRCQPFESLKPGAVLQQCGIRVGELALVAGGPPCQGFSVQRRGKAQDPRNDLVVQYFDLATRLRPRAIMMENVVAMLGVRGKSEMRSIARICEATGYRLHAAVLDAADFGVPQVRRRAFVVAIRSDILTPFAFPEPIANACPVTVREAIGDLPSPATDYLPHASVPNHIRVKISAINELRISHVSPGGGREDIPKELQLPCHRKDNGHRHLDVYGRMVWDKPAPTITAMFDNFTRGRFAHPLENRPITGREGARLQSFPDSFFFTGPKKTVARHIGNAVPPLLAEHIGRAIAACLNGVAADRQLALAV
jgi:DNA (cytosine-5)-methyltransferase 1